MKNGKCPTRRQKLAMKEAGMNVLNWLVCKVDHRTGVFHVINRASGKTKVVPL